MTTKYLIEFINSFLKYNDLSDDAKLVFVDNSDINYRNIENLVSKFSQIDYISSPKNIGFGAANNLGADLYDSQYFLFINNDVEFIEPIFIKLINLFNLRPKCGCIGIKQIGNSPSFFVRQESEVKYSKKQISKFVRYNQEIHFLSGAFLFFKAEIFYEIGKFDSNIFIYFEEADMLNRMIRLGYNSYFEEKLCFLHKVGDRKKSNEQLSKLGSNSFCYYLKKYNIENKIGILKNRTILRRKKQLYFLLKLNFKEVLKLERIINYEKQLFFDYFKDAELLLNKHNELYI